MRWRIVGTAAAAALVLSVIVYALLPGNPGDGNDDVSQAMDRAGFI